MPLSTEKFFVGHSLVTNRAPKGLSLEEIKKHWKTHEVDLESFGLFEVSAPDFNKFYPDVKPEDLVPQDADFAYPVFRALSETRVNKWGPINFGATNALKASIKKLKGQAVYTNHEMVTGNEVGAVMEVFWDEAYTANGTKIPAGINVRLKLDGKANPKLVRSIMMDPPSVHSVSVTVEFEWEQSHPAMSREEFFNKIGNYDAEGKLIERVVTNVVNFHEISLVPHGADPYAQKVNEEGVINNPEYAGQRAKMKFSAEEFKAKGHYMDWKDVASFSLDETIPATQTKTNTSKTSNQNSTEMDEQLLIFLRAQFGLANDAPESVVKAKLMEQLPILQANTATLTTTKDALTALQAKFPEGSELLTAETKTKLTQLEEAKTQLTARVTAEKAEALKLYHIVCGGADKADNAITKMIADASPETTLALLKQYKAQAEEKFSATCQACGSTNVKRTSTASNTGVVTPGSEAGAGTPPSTPAAPKSNAEVMESLSLNKGSISAGIHETPKSE